MVVATTFASNVARVRTLAVAARKAGRSVCLLGRAMQRMVAASEAAGVLHDFPPTITIEDARDVPREHLMLIVTGSQGERRAASAQLSHGKYLGMSMKEGDTFFMSSKIIPGNERGVYRIINAYSEMGVDVVDDNNGMYHVSGHANRPDLLEMQNLVKPQVVSRCTANTVTCANIANWLQPQAVFRCLHPTAPACRCRGMCRRSSNMSKLGAPIWMARFKSARWMVSCVIDCAWR